MEEGKIHNVTVSLALTAGVTPRINDRLDYSIPYTVENNEKSEESMDWSPTAISVGGSKDLSWPELAYENRRFVFHKKLLIRVTRKESVWVYESDEIDLMGFGHNRAEAELSFCYGFVAQWDDIACEDDENLTQDAIDMKRELLALVKTEETK